MIVIRSLSLLLCAFLSLTMSGQEFEKLNLGPNVNSEYSDLSPVISPDGKVLYFVRVGHPENRYGTGTSEDIWFSELRADGNWSGAQRLPIQFNLIKRNNLASVSPDGNLIMIRGAFDNGDYKGKGYSLIYRERGGWTRPDLLDIMFYEDMDVGVYSGAYLSNDGQTLLMYFSESHGSERCDLYYSRLTRKGFWSKPKRLSKTINGKSTDELSPFLAADNRTLYFSSDREGGLGSNDIYMSKRIGDGWNQWTKPMNLGATINSEAWEAYYSISAQGDFAYMVTTQNSLGLEDLVRIPLDKAFRPDPVVMVVGKVLDAKTYLPVMAEVVYENLATGEVVGKAMSDPNNGEYKIVLPYGENYGVSAQISGYYPKSEHLNLKQQKEYSEVNKDLMLSPIEVGQTIRLNNIFFDFNESVLRSESFPELSRVIKLMQENPEVVIKIAGHTDDVGDDHYNLKLSQARARAVRTYLLENGIGEKRVSSQGWGETRPIATNNTEDGKQENRRVEFTIVRR
jgi:OmpA-OmpF porin, OOP family